MNSTNSPTIPRSWVRTVNGVLIQFDRIIDGWSLYVRQGPHRVEHLCRTSADGPALYAAAQSLKIGLGVGFAPGDFEWTPAGLKVTADAAPILDSALAEHCAGPRTVETEPVIEALQRLVPGFSGSDALAAELNADLDAVERYLRDEGSSLADDVAAIMREAGGQRFRDDTRARVMAEARRQMGGTATVHGRCWSDLAEHDRANTKPYLTGRRAELSLEQARVMRLAAPGGWIPVERARVTTLRALAARGMGSLVEGGPGRRLFEVAGFQANNAGMAWLAANREV